MTKVEANTADRPGGDLPELLREALNGSAETADIVAALTVLAPSSAAAWLTENEEHVRSQWAEEDLKRVITRVVTECTERGGNAEATCAVELVERYGDTIDPDTAAAVVSTLDTEEQAGVVSKMTTDALNRWPTHQGLLRLAVDQAVEANDAEHAHGLLTRLAHVDDGQANLSYVWRKRKVLPKEGSPPIRIALLSSFTIDPLAHYLDAECRALGLEPEVYVGPFNSWTQEVLNPESGLRRFEAEIVFLSVSIDDLIPELAGSPSIEQLDELGRTAVERVISVSRQFTAWSDAMLVVHSFHSVYADPYGIAKGRRGRAAWLAELNAAMAEELAGLPRAYMLDEGELLLRRTDGPADNPKMRHIAALRLTGPLLRQTAHAYAHYIAPFKGLSRKCVVLDLDNTLWGGIIGEDGLHGIKLGNTAPGSEYQEFQRYLLSLTERGFLLAVNSKNNLDDAIEVFRSHEGMVLREDSFSAMRINWRPKPENILAIAEELNIGVDSLLFVDDNPNERELMRQMAPDVLTVDLPDDPSLYRSTLEALPQLQKLVVTDEDKTRTELYQARRKREEAKVDAGSLEDYLRSLDIVVEIGQANESTLPRVHQIFERTNQFNLTTRRYQAGELAAFASDAVHRLYTLRAKDRFGDHGIVATALVRADGGCWVIDSFLMSCRVIGYGVETALLSKVSEDAVACGAQELVGEYIETAKNAPARDFYARHEFSELGTKDDVQSWKATLADKAMPCPDWVQVEVADDA